MSLFLTLGHDFLGALDNIADELDGGSGDAGVGAKELLFDRGAHDVAVRGVDTPPLPCWLVRMATYVGLS